jgi:hypothetical protein
MHYYINYQLSTGSFPHLLLPFKLSAHCLGRGLWPDIKRKWSTSCSALVPKSGRPQENAGSQQKAEWDSGYRGLHLGEGQGLSKEPGLCVKRSGAAC